MRKTIELTFILLNELKKRVTWLIALIYNLNEKKSIDEKSIKKLSFKETKSENNKQKVNKKLFAKNIQNENNKQKINKKLFVVKFDI